MDGLKASRGTWITASCAQAHLSPSLIIKNNLHAGQGRANVKYACKDWQLSSSTNTNTPHCSILGRRRGGQEGGRGKKREGSHGVRGDVTWHTLQEGHTQPRCVRRTFGSDAWPSHVIGFARACGSDRLCKNGTGSRFRVRCAPRFTSRCQKR